MKSETLKELIDVKHKILRKLTEVKQDTAELIKKTKKVQILENRPFLIREQEKIDDALLEVAIKLKIIKVAMYNLTNAI